MIDHILLARLKPAFVRQRQRRMNWGCAIGWGTAALAAGLLLFLFGETSYPWRKWWLWMLPAGVTMGLLGAWIASRMRPNVKEIGKRLEAEYPALDGRLKTALEQQPDAEGGFTFLQEHLFTETIHHSTEADWSRGITGGSLWRARLAQFVALPAFILLWVLLLPSVLPGSKGTGSTAAGEAQAVTVNPGDVELEKGSALVLLARFGGAVPASAELVTGESAESEKHRPLTRSLNDPVFGGTVDNVQEPFSYRVAWEGGSSPAYRVTVFEYPKLERPDVTLTYPEYTKLPAKRIEDSRHVAAVEGTRIDLDLALNKPVVSAVLQPKKPSQAKEEAAAEPVITLETAPDKASAQLRGFVPVRSGRYELVLTDDAGRKSRQAVAFSFDVVPNRVPDMKLASPKGDQRPSALQEILFDGTVWDDFGVLAWGLAVTAPDGKTVSLEFGKDLPAREKKAFQHLLRLEEWKAEPDQLFAWHTWADDTGPDGNVRRTRGDLFFAEIRQFEEIFRQGAGTENQQNQNQEQQPGGEQQQQNDAARLAELQKQIMNATWKLVRNLPAEGAAPEKGAEDINVVRESQEDARAQAEEAAEAGGGPRNAARWQQVLNHMQQAVERLGKARETTPELTVALASEQAAYQLLLQLQPRDREVSRSNQQSQSQQSQSQGQQQQQQQLDQLDLTQEQNRYETQREAQAQQSAERREQMQILNRLKELAERQEDVNEKLKELQTALNEAQTEQEREEARRQLRRLEEEQRQMLADADELRQRMEQRRNQSQSAEQQQQLDEARQNMQQAAEAAAEGQAGQALASGTRAREQMQEMREEMRRQSAGAFEEELRQMRAEARELARNQEQIAKQLNQASPEQQQPQPGEPVEGQGPPPARGNAPSLGDAPQDENLTQALAEQEQRTGDLVQRATELSEQAEPAEPLLSRQIYETARQFAQEDTGTVKEAQRELLQEGRLSDRMYEQMRELQASERAGKGVKLTAELQRLNETGPASRTAERTKENLERLRDGVEQAAESVLGDDTGALRLAESQLEAAEQALRREMEQQEGPGGQQPQQPGQQSQPGQNQQQGQSQETAQGESRQGDPNNSQNPGQGGQGQQEMAENQSPQQGQGRGQGQRPGQGGQGQGAQPEESRPGGEQPRQGEENPQLAQQQQENQQPSREEQGQGQGQGQEGQQAGGGRGQRPGQGQGPGQGGEQEIAEGQTPEGQESPQEGRGGQGGGGNVEVAENRQRRGGSEQTGGGNGGGTRGGPVSENNSQRAVRNQRVADAGPLTGEGFTEWSDALRDAEELMDGDSLRSGIASAREQARRMRQEIKRGDLKKPDWKVVQAEIINPLVEVRQRVREELARRDTDKSLVPVDRDPVPAQFTENVQRYYEELGRDQ